MLMSYKKATEGNKGKEEREELSHCLSVYSAPILWKFEQHIVVILN